ncbi:MAG: hypothetical protein ONB48_04115 [candidate division KSB1 bacterium]|nr:hypothetical protein [candidate division KSB1 bacterium]MDZ7274504.1 hypothetical protein [candidate division KSB1 bacterium]MDZ7284835.1 hypothetical protein [candidate division KSB1 bacterium]MDZ7297745.1 hypothetical protein [candidate division KSB1 bacterium]MDZ7307580.1 hypothetical protein [candidate division KSB1 bacterium]
MKDKFLLWLWGAVLLTLSSAHAQSTLEVKLSATLTPEEVPLNRTAIYRVELTWRGDLARVAVDPPEPPRLANLKLVGTASANRVGVESGTTVATHVFEYTLRPQGLGMGYVETMRVGYLDKATNEKHELYASRLSTKVIEALPEPGETPVTVIVLAALGLALAGGMGFALWRAQRRRAARAQQAAQVVKPLEDEFCEELQATVEVNAPDTKEAFTKLSRILRAYLHRRFEIPTQGITTAEVVEAYRRLHPDSGWVTQLEEVLQTSDVVKFSGAGGDPGQLARAYAMTESFLRAHRSESVAPPSSK